MNIFRSVAAAAISLVVATAATAQDTRDYLVATAGTGGSFYPVGVGIATLVKLKLGTREENKINLSALTSQGSYDNVNILSDGRAQFGIIQSLMTDFGYHGTNDFDGSPRDNLRAVSALMFNTNQFITFNDKAPTGTISDILGLEGQKVVLGAKNSGGLLEYRMFIQKLGAPKGEGFFDESYMGFRQRAEALINGNLDGINLTSGVPNSSVTLAMSSLQGKVKLLGFSDEELAKVTDGTVWGPYTIPAGTYPGQDETVQTVAQPNLLVSTADVPEDVVYDITKAMYENLPFLQSVHGSLKDMTPENAMKGVTIPLHPGAVRYYEEMGLTIPDHLLPS
ncbi:TAXI family TRAP transporter solute-binding subunit [Alloyangia pacifica]|uniref:TAXI family TRAP transporter solute-binding subunit n=1 Tax=Alloyangia pacifica TaxID=311180 RepID=UPI001CFE502D|nr:TAXI family TRAP transporter solute-binding subunit [Alloyangia pacifica]